MRTASGVRRSQLLFRSAGKPAEAGDLTGLGCHLLEWLAVRIVDVSDGGKLKPSEPTQIWQIVAIEVEVVKTAGSEKARKGCARNEQTHEAELPMNPRQPGRTQFSNRSDGAHAQKPESAPQEHRSGQTRRRPRDAHREVAFAGRFIVAMRDLESPASAGAIVRASVRTQLYRL